jgi:hypothetical protein
MYVCNNNNKKGSRDGLKWSKLKWKAVGHSVTRAIAGLGNFKKKEKAPFLS